MLASGSGLKVGEKAIIISPTYTSKISKCVEFWYFMSGKHSGSLKVYAKVNTTRLLLWSRSSNHGNIWSLAQVTVRNLGTFNVEIEAVIEEESANIAIDDFGMFDGDCPKTGKTPHLISPFLSSSISSFNISMTRHRILLIAPVFQI